MEFSEGVLRQAIGGVGFFKGRFLKKSWRMG
jgi:hypothetical protein